jgi:hypothetical protein
VICGGWYWFEGLSYIASNKTEESKSNTGGKRSITYSFLKALPEKRLLSG